jgi:hypothetical protein
MILNQLQNMQLNRKTLTKAGMLTIDEGMAFS